MKRPWLSFQPNSPFTRAMFRPLPMLFFTLLMRLGRKAETTSECRDTLEVLVKQCDGDVAD